MLLLIDIIPHSSTDMDIEFDTDSVSLNFECDSHDHMKHVGIACQVVEHAIEIMQSDLVWIQFIIDAE